MMSDQTKVYINGKEVTNYAVDVQSGVVTIRRSLWQRVRYRLMRWLGRDTSERVVLIYETSYGEAEQHGGNNEHNL